ncbi:hypothetical protein [Asaia platycodi]|nr:hypothetical protein [Asaia platycodi]
MLRLATSWRCGPIMPLLRVALLGIQGALAAGVHWGHMNPGLVR